MLPLRGEPATLRRRATSPRSAAGFVLLNPEVSSLHDCVGAQLCGSSRSQHGLHRATGALCDEQSKCAGLNCKQFDMLPHLRGSQVLLHGCGH